MEKKKLSTKDMAYIGLFACLMAICAWISIPGQIPFTLQTMGVFLAVGLLGGKRGTLAVLVLSLIHISEPTRLPAATSSAFWPLPC